MEHETIDIAHESNSPSQQHNINGEGTPENELMKFVPVTALLEMVTSRLGVLVCGWAAVVLVQGGIVFTLETKDRVFVTVIFLLVCICYWRYFCPQATGSLTEASQSLSADNLSIANDMQQLTLPIHFISRVFYWYNLVSALTCAVLSIMRLASHDFGQTEVANMATRDFALYVFYGVELVEVVVVLLYFVITLVNIMAMPRALTEALFELAKKLQSNNFLHSLSADSSNRRMRPRCKSKHKLQKLQAESRLYCGLNSHQTTSSQPFFRRLVLN